MTPYQEVPVASVLGSSRGEAWLGAASMGSQRGSGMSLCPCHAFSLKHPSLFSLVASETQLKPHLLEFSPHPFCTGVMNLSPEQDPVYPVITCDVIFG